MPRKPLSSGLQLLTAPKTLTVFLLGGVAIGVLGNAVYQLLTNWLTTSYTGAAIILGIALLALLVVVVWLGQYAKEFRYAPPLAGKRSPALRQGLILLVSNEPVLRRAVDWHARQLRHCWLLYSEQTMELALKLKNELTAAGKDVHTELVGDVFDPMQCYEVVNRIYSALPDGLLPQDVILDFTGMTAAASVGAVLACLDEKRAMQYTPATYDEEMKALQPHDPVEIVLHWGLFTEKADKQS